MYLSVHLDVVDAPHFAIGARRRRGGSRVSVSGQARDGGTRGVNQKHDKMKKIINTKIANEVLEFESGVIRNSTINSKSRIRIAGAEIDNTQIDGKVVLENSVVKDCKISGHSCSIDKSTITNCNIIGECSFFGCVVKDSTLYNAEIRVDQCRIWAGKSNKVVIPTSFNDASIKITNGFVDMTFFKYANNVWSFKKVKLSDFLRDYYKL